MSFSVQQITTRTDASGKCVINLDEDMPDVEWSEVHFGIAHMNSSNGAVEWTKQTGDREFTVRIRRTIDGISEGLPEATVTLALQVWGLAPDETVG